MRYLVCGLLALALLLTLALPPEARAASVPAGFVDEPVTQASFPTALVFTPDGRLLIAQQTGELLIYRLGTPTPAIALNLSAVVCANFERGLLGVAVDPGFAANGFIYLYYTFKRNTACTSALTAGPDHPVNRVSRFTLVGDTAAPGSEQVLVDTIPSISGRHNAGDLHIGADGYLYISVGESGTGGGLAQNRGLLGGKILRVDRTTGAGVAGNPFFGTAGARRCGAPGTTASGGVCEEIFAWGLRNPLRMAFVPGTSSFYINDVGQRIWEEIDRGQAGANYGWSSREGPCPANQRCTPGAQTPPADPLFSYRHGGNPLPSPFQDCNAVTGGAFVPPGAWGPAYDGVYLFGDYTCGTVFQLRQQPDGTFAATVFAQSLGGSSVVDLEFGPDGGGGQALYYTNYATGAIGRLRSTLSVGAPPVAQATADVRYGKLPLGVQFDGSASSDPDGQALSYRWSFGDGQTSAEARPRYSYQKAGVYTATLTVSDPRGLSARSAPLVIYAGDTPATPTISAPAATYRYGVGETLALRGSALDPEDGALGAAALVWQVTLHHDQHTHPYLPPSAGNGVSVTTPAPEDLAAVKTSYLQIDLRARDSWGLLSPPVTLNVYPQIVTVTLDTQPSGMLLQVNGELLRAPAQLPSWPGYVCAVVGPAQADGAGQQLILTRWGDSVPGATRAITTPMAGGTFLAVFEPARSLFLPVGRR